MRGFLSPTSRTNCAYSDTFCSLTPKAGMQCIDDKCSTMGYSQMIQSPSQTKFYSFKKIKQDRIKQKNQQGKVVKQMVYKDKKRKIQKIKTLNDAPTILSHNSPRSSISVGKKVVQQSIIIMRGRDLDMLTKQDRQHSFTIQKQKQQPETPCFKRRNTFQQQNNFQSDFLKPISINPAFVKSIESGMIYHFQIVNCSQIAYENIKNVHHEGILQIFAVIALKSCFNNLSLVLYQPYTESLSQKLIKAEVVNFKQLIHYMIQVIKILAYLSNLNIYPQIEPTTVLLSHSTIKIKLRYQQNLSTTQRQTLRQCGYYFSSLVKSLNGCCSTPSSSRHGKNITGLTISKRIQFDILMNEFIRFQDYTLDEAYVKLQAFQCS